jgi:CubicO group peptidase (beta-lactamase class C family)
MQIHGHCDDRFDGVLKAFETNFKNGDEVGASFAATVEGEFVVDIWAGHRDAAKTQPWAEDTIVCVYSSTKTMTSLCALMLADRGQLDLDAPVFNYWPEFKANGKEGVLVKHVLSHSAGLPVFSHRLTTKELYDWDLVCADLAQQATLWEPGTQSGYHAITQGFLIGEVVRRITGKSIGTYFKQEVVDKVGADFHIGVDPQDFHRIADVVEDPRPAALDEVNKFLNMDPDSLSIRAIDGIDLTEEDLVSAAWRAAEVPAANGHGYAKSIVRAQTAMANGGTAFGVKLLSPEGCARALEPETDGTDLVVGVDVTQCMGYGRNMRSDGKDLIQFGSGDGTLFWGGAGGSIVVIDTKANVCVSYVMNQSSNSMFGDPRANSLGVALYAGL